MKRCVFAGPSIHGVTDLPKTIEFLPPASRGDLIAAARDGAGIIGLIDGYFGTCASVWHKEILFALSIGCQVWGAASMGALRAAECWTFGMRPVGAIAEQYRAGVIRDDAEVAILHGPVEIDYVPLTEAMVDVRATVASMLSTGRIFEAEASDIVAAAKSIHFSERTLEAILAALGTKRCARLETYEACRVRAKQADAAQLLREIQTVGKKPEIGDWTLAKSRALSSLFEG